jgi:hypothetical protein
MTHGDKAKAKTGKSSSQTSAKKVKVAEPKAGGKEKGGKGDKAAGTKQQAGREKAASAIQKGSSAGAKDSTPATGSADAKGKARVEGSNGTGFSNAAVASAFKHALKKYPNALRRLTD